jgi:hypothetical protein
VRVLSRRPDPRLAALGAEVVVGDICDAAALGRLVAGCGVVYHLAGVVEHSRQVRSEKPARTQLCRADCTRATQMRVESPRARIEVPGCDDVGKSLERRGLALALGVGRVLATRRVRGRWYAHASKRNHNVQPV